MVQGDMTTKEIIDELRDQADVIGPGTECNLLHAAADRLEAIEERVAIMSTERDTELVRCKDCKHRGIAKGKSGFDIEWPDGDCPCRSDDPYYSWLPSDDWYCADAERKQS